VNFFGEMSAPGARLGSLRPW